MIDLTCYIQVSLLRSVLIYLSLFLYICPSTHTTYCLGFPSIYPFSCLPIHLTVCLSFYISICLPLHFTVSLYIQLSVYLYIYLSISLISIYQSICISLYSSIYIYIYLSIYISIYLSIFLSISPSKTWPPRVLICLVIIILFMKIRGVVRTLAMINCS